MKILDHLAQGFPLEKRTPKVDGIFEYLHTKSSETSASIPQYLALLRKHGLDSTNTSPSAFNVKDIRISSGASLSKHTLYFKTLSKTVYISAYDPVGHGSAGMCRYVHLYESSDRYLGVAEITDLDLIRNALNVRRNGSGDFTQSNTNKFPIRIAVVSGPSSPAPETRRNLWIGGHLESLVIQTKAELRFYQVLLLMRHITPSCNSVDGVYERAGLGEIPAPILETLDGLSWEYFLLQ